ncbi:MAG: hypothetical protein PHU85_16720 [Phycisphaerae bacterium]|nr:hypothetical protein [Phycisphaerae bacterium]
MDDFKRSGAVASSGASVGAGLSDFVIESLLTQRPMASRSRLEFRCPACGNLLRAGAASAGRAVRCPACGIAFHVPDRPVPTWLRD